MKRVVYISFLTLGIIISTNDASAISFAEPSSVALMQDVSSAIRQAQARFDSGNVAGAADLAKKILAKYPNNAEAKAIMDKCIAREREDYEKAVGSLSVSELRAFQNKYPESEYMQDVSKRIADLPFWLEAKEKNTIESYKKYISESTYQIYKQGADAAIKDLTIKQAYDDAVATNTIKAFEQFRSKYPGSEYDKQASNKIARLMADKFNSKSTYTDKNNALAYAKNEITRDYVNNKYNKATEKKYSSTSSGSSTKTYNSTTTTAYSSSQNTRKNDVSTQSVRPQSIVNFGLQGYFEFANVTASSSPVYSGGVGFEARIGTINKPLNLLVGAKFGWAYFKYSYYERQPYGDKSWEYDSVNIENSGRSTNLFIPIALNWNFLKSDLIGWYLGAGYQFGIPISVSFSPGKQSHAYFIQSGLGFRHFDIRMYYIRYFSSLFVDTEAKTPVLGFSMTYYF